MILYELFPRDQRLFALNIVKALRFLSKGLWNKLLLLLLLLYLILLDYSVMFTINARSNPGSGALMGSHGLHLIDRTFRRMWLDPRRAIFCSSVMLIFSGNSCHCVFWCLSWLLQVPQWQQALLSLLVLLLLLLLLLLLSAYLMSKQNHFCTLCLCLSLVHFFAFLCKQTTRSPNLKFWRGCQHMALKCSFFL